MVVALKPLHDIARDQARRRRDLPVGQRRRQGGHGRAVRADQGDLRERPQGAVDVHRSRSPSTSSRRSTSSWRTAPPRRSGRWWWRRRRSSTPDRGHRHLRARAGVRRPCRGGQCRVREPDRAPTRRARRCARPPGVVVVDEREAASYITPARMRRRRMRSSSAASAPTRPSTRPEPLGGLRQSAQGRRAQRGPDRRGHGRGRPALGPARAAGHRTLDMAGPVAALW